MVNTPLHCSVCANFFIPKTCDTILFGDNSSLSRFTIPNSDAVILNSQASNHSVEFVCCCSLGKFCKVLPRFSGGLGSNELNGLQ